MMKRFGPLAFVVVVAIGFLVASFGTDLFTGRQVPSDWVAGAPIGGSFSLTDHHGTRVTDQTYADKHKLIYFGFASCPDICPTELKKIAAALDRLGDKATKLHALFISVDPARDTPAVLKEYVALFHKDLIGLTGTEAEVDQVIDAYRVYAQKLDPVGNADYMIDHSSFIYLMSPDNKPMAIYRKQDTADHIAADIEKRLTSAP